MLVEAYPNLDKKSELEAVHPVLDFTFDETTKKDGWGAMNRENWKDQIDTYASLKQFKGKVPTVDDVMTLSVLDATIRHPQEGRLKPWWCPHDEVAAAGIRAGRLRGGRGRAFATST